MPTTPDEPQTTDRIEKQFVVNAPQSRVWRAISDATEFGTWFGMEIDGPFAPGATVHGRLTIAGYEHLTLEMQVERIDPEEYFSYHWHPYAVDPVVDYSKEPMTLVEFRLATTDTGTTVTIIESGFDRLPATRRAEAFRMNTGGWEGQSKKLARHVE